MSIGVGEHIFRAVAVYVFLFLLPGNGWEAEYEKKRSVLQSACDELIDKGRQIVGYVNPELDEFVQ